MSARLTGAGAPATSGSSLIVPVKLPFSSESGLVPPGLYEAQASVSFLILCPVEGYSPVAVTITVTYPSQYAAFENATWGFSSAEAEES